MTDTAACPICTEKFLRTANRKPVICHLCEYTACSGCCQTYLLGSIQDAHCMNCRREWSKEFTIQSFSGTFINQTYKKHREDILMARQKSMLPLRVAKIERMNRGRDMDKELEPLRERIERKKAYLNKLERQYYNKINIRNILLRGDEPPLQGDVAAGLNKQRIVEFHKPCPANDCRGFLNTQYKCGICSILVCSDCYEIKGLDKDAEHTCKHENVESVKLKKKQCKNCPECGSEIYKEIGCDQMWCTQCKTTFDWKTGAKLVNVKVHNPHYYEYLRRTQGSVPRDIDDQPHGGGAACYNQHETIVAVNRIGQLSTTLKRRIKNLIIYGITEVIRTISHIDSIEIHRNTTVVTESTNEDIDIQYLRNEIDEKSWKQMLQNREKQRIKKQDILQILQMVSQAAKDIIVSFINNYILNVRAINDEVKKMKILTALTVDIWKQLEGIRTLSNESFEKHSRLYKCQAPKIELLDIGDVTDKASPENRVSWNYKLKYNYLLDDSASVQSIT